MNNHQENPSTPGAEMAAVVAANDAAGKTSTTKRFEKSATFNADANSLTSPAPSAASSRANSLRVHPSGGTSTTAAAAANNNNNDSSSGGGSQQQLSPQTAAATASPSNQQLMATTSAIGNSGGDDDADMIVALAKTVQNSGSELTTSKALHVNHVDNPNYQVYRKMEAIVKRMQKDSESGGVNIRTVKSFMSKIPNVTTGADIVSWLSQNLTAEDSAKGNSSSSSSNNGNVNNSKSTEPPMSPNPALPSASTSVSTVESLLLANRMSAHGYFFPIDDRNLSVKNDHTYYRFQTPYYWPSKNVAPENTDYAVYLCKRTMRNNNRKNMELADYEVENLTRLRKMFSRKWEYIQMQAQAQAKVDKKRDKAERKLLETQERAFWDVYRPPPGCVNTTESDIKKVLKGSIVIENPAEGSNKPEDLRDAAILRRRLNQEMANLKTRVDKCTIRVSKCAETYVEYYNIHHEYDAFLVASEPSNPWTSDSTELWEMYEKCAKDQVAERRVRRWGFSCWELLKDPIGHDHFRAFLEKEYATENLLFVEAVWKMKKLPLKRNPEECEDIWKKFLAPGAEIPVNIDSKTHKVTEENMKRGPDRWTFDDAAAHLYYLMTSDSYSRYLRSSHYKDFLEGSRKKTGTSKFGLPKKLMVGGGGGQQPLS